MKKLSILALVAALCLALGGCRVLGEVSHYFAGVEDFVRGNPKPTAAIITGDEGEDDEDDGGNGGNGTPQTFVLTIVCFKRPVLDISVVSKAMDGDEPAYRNDDEPDITATGTDPGHFRVLEGVPGGAYTLTFTTGKRGAASDLETFRVDFSLQGDTTLMLMINEEPDTNGRDVRAVALPGSIEGVPVI